MGAGVPPSMLGGRPLALSLARMYVKFPPSVQSRGSGTSSVYSTPQMRASVKFVRISTGAPLESGTATQPLVGS